MAYHLTDHTADVGIRIISPTLESLFEEAANAMLDQITDTNLIDPQEERIIKVSGDDLPDLLVGWLREVLFLWTGMEMLTKSTEIVSLSEKKLEGRVRIEPYQAKKHVMKSDIKAVTYHQINVIPCAEGWETTVIFDV